jgi:molybdate transport system permease protein
VTRRASTVALVALGAPLFAFLVLPLAVLIVRSLAGGLAAGLRDPGIAEALRLSAATTMLALGASIALGIPLAYLLARRQFRGAQIVETLIDLPIVLPPAVAGLALLLAFGRRGPLGGLLEPFGVALPFSTIAVVLAQVFVAAPLFVRAARAGFAAVDRELEDAARVDGAGDLAAFAFVTIPLARSALTAGAVLAWARALGEFGATIMFAGNVEGVTQTLPLAVYARFQLDVDAAIGAAVLLIVAAFLVLLAVRVTRWRSPLELRRVG